MYLFVRFYVVHFGAEPPSRNFFYYDLIYVIQNIVIVFSYNKSLTSD